MLPLAAKSLPSSSQELSAAIREGFGEHGIVIRNVAVEGGEFPNVESFLVDLTEARFARQVRVPKPGPASGAAFQTGSLKIAATPLYFESLPLSLKISATDAGFACATAANGESILALQRAVDGHLEIEIERAALEAFLKSLATDAAAKQGANIKETHLELVSRGPRSLSFRAEVLAKIFVMTASVTLAGDLEVDDALNLHVSNLALSGNAMATSLIGKFARPYFDQVQSQPISLAALSLGEVRLRDVAVSGGDALRLKAQFGS